MNTPAEAPVAQEPSEFIENRTYDEIAVGDQSVLTRTLRPEDIQLFAIMSGDVNPAHVEPEYARSSMFQEKSTPAVAARPVRTSSAKLMPSAARW